MSFQLQIIHCVIILKTCKIRRCFKVFDIAHSLAVTPEAVFHSTYDTIKEFKDDNVIYLELRSTPRVIQGKMTKEECVEAIIKAFE